MSSVANEAALIWCPLASLEEARRVADILLGERVVACANILPSIESRFLWQGERDNAQEAAVLFKTLPRLVDTALTRLIALASYDQPAPSAWTVTTSPGTRAWLEAELDPALGSNP